MEIQETDSFIVFKDVDKYELPYFEDFKYELWFLSGTVSNGLFVQPFTGTGLDLSDYTTEDKESKDIELKITLYYWK